MFPQNSSIDRGYWMEFRRVFWWFYKDLGYVRGIWLFNGLCLDIYREYWGEPSATRILINISTTINRLIQDMYCFFRGTPTV